MQQNMLPDLVSMIVNSIATIQNWEHLEFVQDFISTYTDHLDEKLGHICQAVVSRIVAEH